jgi:hypothetical protein
MRRPNQLRSAIPGRNQDCSRVLDLTLRRSSPSCAANPRTAEACREQFCFVVAPLAHPRYHRDFTGLVDRAEPFTRSDMLLSSSEWSSSVVGLVSPWISLDSQAASRSLAASLCCDWPLQLWTLPAATASVKPTAHHAGLARTDEQRGRNEAGGCMGYSLGLARYPGADPVVRLRELRSRGQPAPSGVPDSRCVHTHTSARAQTHTPFRTASCTRPIMHCGTTGLAGGGCPPRRLLTDSHRAREHSRTRAHTRTRARAGRRPLRDI